MLTFRAELADIMNKTYLVFAGILFSASLLCAGAASGSTGKHGHSHPHHYRTKVIKDAIPDSVYKARLMALHFECEMFYNGAVRKSIQLYTLRARKNTERILGLGNFYFPLIDSIFDLYGVPREMKYIAIIESSLNPRAISKGVTGMWQFTKGTGQKFGLKVNNLVDERRSIKESTVAVAQYLKLLHRMYNNWQLVLAAYNCGSGRVNYAIRKMGAKSNFRTVSPFLPQITRNFVSSFMGIAYSFNYYQQHNLVPASCELPSGIDAVVISRPLYLQQVSTVLNINLNTLRNINSQYLHDYIPAGTSGDYLLYLPSEQKANFLQLSDSVFAVTISHMNSNYKQVIPSLKETPGSSGRIIHKVRSGESLYTIAKHNHITLVQLREWNKLKGDKIKPGQKLIVYNK